MIVATQSTEGDPRLKLVNGDRFQVVAPRQNISNSDLISTPKTPIGSNSLPEVFHDI